MEDGRKKNLNSRCREGIIGVGGAKHLSTVEGASRDSIRYSRSEDGGDVKNFERGVPQEKGGSQSGQVFGEKGREGIR